MSAAPELRSARFRREREGDWQRLERLLRRLESAPVSKLADDDLLALPVLYRSALSSLSVARETTLDQGTLDYLESLCTRAYFVVYGARPNLLGRLAAFFRSGGCLGGGAGGWYPTTVAFITHWPVSAMACWPRQNTSS